MAIKFETQIIRTIAIFEKVTKVHAKDCLVNDKCAYFIVDSSKVGLAIGKNGSTVKDMRKILGKQIKIFGYSDNPENMINNMIPNTKSVEMNNGSIVISIPKEDRLMVIGKNGSNIKIIKEILKRHFSIKNVRLR